MRKKGLVKVGIAVAVSLFSLFGCGGEETKPTETTTVVESKEETSTESGAESVSSDKEEVSNDTTTSKNNTSETSTQTTEGSVGTFDPEDVCKNISVNGKLVEFPWTLEKLGDEYTHGHITNPDLNDGYCASGLVYNGEETFTVVWKAEEVKKDSTIVRASCSVRDGIKVYNIGEGSVCSDVIKKLGEPNIKNDDKVSETYFYKKNGLIISFLFIDNELVFIGLEVSGEER